MAVKLGVLTQRMSASAGGGWGGEEASVLMLPYYRFEGGGTQRGCHTGLNDLLSLRRVTIVSTVSSVHFSPPVYNQPVLMLVIDGG
jgi:hypothetical protein